MTVIGEFNTCPWPKMRARLTLIVALTLSLAGCVQPGNSSVALQGDAGSWPLTVRYEEVHEAFGEPAYVEGHEFRGTSWNDWVDITLYIEGRTCVTTPRPGVASPDNEPSENLGLQCGVLEDVGVTIQTRPDHTVVTGWLADTTELADGRAAESSFDEFPDNAEMVVVEDLEGPGVAPSSVFGRVSALDRNSASSDTAVAYSRTEASDALADRLGLEPADVAVASVTYSGERSRERELIVHLPTLLPLETQLSHPDGSSVRLYVLSLDMTI